MGAGSEQAGIGSNTAAGPAAGAVHRSKATPALIILGSLLFLGVSGFSLVKLGILGGRATIPPPGTTVLDRLHQAMILFGAQRGELLKRFLVEDGVGQDARFWKLAQSLAALYPPGTEERRWVVQDADSRALSVTRLGEREMQSRFDVRH